MVATQGIYAIWHRASGRCYVGSSVNIERRWNDHRVRLKNGKHPSTHLLRAYRLYGSEAFHFSILEIIDLSNDAVRIEREQFWIDRLRPAFNLAPVAGSLLGFKRSAESRARMAAAQKGRASPLKGVPRSPEARAAISAGKKGKTHASEHRAKLSAALKGRTSPRKGVVLSAETKERISASKKGKPMHPATKEAIAAGQRRRWAAYTETHSGSSVEVSP